MSEFNVERGQVNNPKFGHGAPTGATVFGLTYYDIDNNYQQYISGLDGTWHKSGTPSPVLSVKMSINASQLQKLHSAPIVLVSSPGVSKVICPLQAILKFLVGGSQYTYASIAIAYDQGNSIIPGLQLMIDGATDAIAVLNSNVNFTSAANIIQTGDPTLYLGKDVVLTDFIADNSDGDGTLELILNYTIADFT